jgi:hypothetical protein
MKRVYEGDRQEARRQAVAAYRAANPDRSRKQWRSYKKRKTEAMAGRPKPDECENCGNRGRICYDHCHATGAFRGWICSDCNLLIGKAKDDAKLLRRVADYLEGTNNDCVR